MTQIIRFHLNIGYEQYLRVYQGISKTVRTRADDGRIIDFPAANVQSFLNKDGIHGYFEMTLTAEHKFIGIRKLD